MLEFLTPDELREFSRALDEYRGLAAPFFDGYCVGEVLQYMLETPNEFDPGWADLYMRNIGFDHVEGHYVYRDLLPVLIVDLCAPLGASDLDRFQILFRILADFAAQDMPEWLAEFPNITEARDSFWRESCGVFGLSFDTSGAIVPWDE